VLVCRIRVTQTEEQYTNLAEMASLFKYTCVSLDPVERSFQTISDDISDKFHREGSGNMLEARSMSTAAYAVRALINNKNNLNHPCFNVNYHVVRRENDSGQ
jgi:hypothetical protein